MKVRPSAWFLSFLLLAACPEKDKETTEESTSDKPADKPADGTTAAGGPTANNTPPTPTSPTGANPTTTTTSTTPTGATTDAAPKPAGIEPKVKAEVDNRPEGLAGGTKLNVANAKAAIDAPKDWKITKGETTVASSADDKARVAVAAFGPEGPNQRIPTATQAAGLSNCQWAPPENVTAGKDKLSAQVADGVCTRGAGQVKAAMMAVEGLLVIGSWDEGGDQANVFAAFRSVAKAAVGTDALAACCAALRQNAKSAPPQQMGLYMMAAGACDSARKNPDSVKALAGVRGMLAGANVPASCR